MEEKALTEKTERGKIEKTGDGDCGMEKERLDSIHGYGIFCANNLEKGQQKAIIVCHGFGSSKESPTVQLLNQKFPKYGMGTYSFDFPVHGESDAPGEALRIVNCLDDLAVVEARVRRLLPQAEIGYFASSFGAYVVLLYLALRPHEGRRAFLRSAAVDMPGIFRRWISEEAERSIAKRGYFLLDYEYTREIRIYPPFLEELAAYSVFDRYQKGTAVLFLIHGEEDDTAPLTDARRFARQAGAKLKVLPGAGHRLMGEGEPETVLAYANLFFQAEE